MHFARPRRYPQAFVHKRVAMHRRNPYRIEPNLFELGRRYGDVAKWCGRNKPHRSATFRPLPPHRAAALPRLMQYPIQ